MKGSLIAKIGVVTDDYRLTVTGIKDETIICEKISALKSAWQKTLNF